MAVASAGPYANHLHLATDISMPVSHNLVFTGQVPFLPPSQQCQSSEGKTAERYWKLYRHTSKQCHLSKTHM